MFTEYRSTAHGPVSTQLRDLIADANRDSAIDVDCSFGGRVHFYVDDVDELHREFRNYRVSFKQTPANSLDPDIRDMLVVDPDGNRLSFLNRAF